MLSKEEREELQFIAKNKIPSPPKGEHVTMTIDEYLKFLNDIQKVFGPFKVDFKPPITKYNKL